MKNLELWLWTIVVLFVGIIIGYLISREIYSGKVVTVGYPKTEYKYDTIIKPGATIKIKGKGSITYTNTYDTLFIKDTVYNSKAFISILDTIIKKDTIHVAYFFPLDMHYITLKKGSDSIFVKTITIQQPVKEVQPWYQQPLIIIGSLGAGYLIGKATK